MKNHIFFVFALLFCFTASEGQDLVLSADTSVVTTHRTTINGKSISYQAETGTIPVWDEKGMIKAYCHYTYYKQEGITDVSKRPLLISFNGGPGSGSVWMHLAYTGPRVLKIDDEGFPTQPYGYKSNPHSVLDVADIVYVNPVNTGYSRTVGEEVDRSMFFGVNADISYLSDWIRTFVTRKNRWTSPKFLIGESYGTTRVSGLAYELQNSEWMYCNGVVLVSPTSLGIDRQGAIESANRIPYYTAAAWYHKKLNPELQSLSLEKALEASEKFTQNELIAAISKGSLLSDQERKDLASRMAYFSGIDARHYLEYNLDLPKDFFWKELLRDSDGLTIGRLDSRYTGRDSRLAGEKPDGNSELIAWLHSFTPAINAYYRDELNWKTDLPYNMFGPVRPWDRSNDETGRNLSRAMLRNPFMHVMVQSGYFDGATTYYDAKYNLWQMDPSGQMADRMSFKGYYSGHMMYLRAEDLQKANQDLREFITQSIPAEGVPAKYK